MGCTTPPGQLEGGWIGVFSCIFGMYWPDPGWKEKHFITVLFPKQVTLSFSNVGSSNQVLNGIPIIQMLWKLKWFTLLVTLPNCAGRLFRWSIRLIQQDKWQGLLVRCCPKSSKKLSHKKITLKHLQFSDFKKSRIKVCHLCEMDVVEAEMTKLVTPNLWN